MSLYHTTASAESPPPPREGLPPCVKVGLYADRVVVLYDRSCECGQLFDPALPRYCSMAGPVSSYSDSRGHPDHRVPHIMFGTEALHLDTDDEAEAAAAYERGERYVRTGVLDEG